MPISSGWSGMSDSERAARKKQQEETAKITSK